MNTRRIPPTYNLLVLAFLAAPLIVVIAASFNEAPFLSFPPDRFSLKWYASVLKSQDFLDSFLVSMEIAVFAVLVALCIGVPASLAISRFQFPGSGLVRGLAMAPLTFPEVLLGLALLEFFVVVLEINLGLSTLILGHVVITTPFVVQIVTSGFTSFDISVEEAAYTLGASPIRTFFSITWPMMRTSIF